MKKILNAPFIREIGRIATYMYNDGWDERNAGNISYLLSDEEVNKYLKRAKVIKEIPIGMPILELASKYFLITGTGKYFRNVEKDPEDTLGIIRVSEDGCNAQLMWGYKNGGRPTCELAPHLISHAVRLKQDKNHRTVIHTHPTYIVVMDATNDFDEAELAHKLWQTHTEAIAVFPDGVGKVPCMVNGTTDIGKATAEKLEEYRLVVWSNHGIYGTGGTLDETYGLIEVVEKSAKMFVLKQGSKINHVISDDILAGLAKQFNVEPRKGILKI